MNRKRPTGNQSVPIHKSRICNDAVCVHHCQVQPDLLLAITTQSKERNSRLKTKRSHPSLPLPRHSATSVPSGCPVPHQTAHLLLLEPLRQHLRQLLLLLGPAVAVALQHSAARSPVAIELRQRMEAAALQQKGRSSTFNSSSGHEEQQNNGPHYSDPPNVT
ncbi:hypothetical protein Vafri_90 [Volvox africanus]|nr:hypothetical protein Vafri_90 [Volvox africanus]